MADETLDYLIRLQSEGGDQVKGEIEGVKDSASKAGPELEEAGEGAKKFNTHGREMHKLMHELNHIAPGLGNVLKVIFRPELMGIVAAITAVKVLVELIGEFKRKLNEVAEAQAAMEVAHWEAQIQKLQDAKTAASDYNEVLKSIWTSVDALKQKEDEELKVLQAIEAARRKILEAQEAAEKAAAKGDPVAEAGVAARYSRKKSDEELAAEQDAIDLKQTQELARAEAEKKAAAKLKQAQAANVAGLPVDAYTDAKGRLEKDGKTLSEAEKNLKINKGLADADREYFSQHPEPGRGESLAEGLERKSLAEVQAAKTQMESDKHIVANHEAALKKLTAAVKEAEADYKREHEARAALDQELKTAREVHRINTGAAKAAADVAAGSELAQAGFKPGSVLGRTLLGDINAEEGRAHGERMTSGQAKGITDLVAALRAAGRNQNEINQIIKDMMDLHKSHAEKLIELATALSQIKAQAKAAHNP